MAAGPDARRWLIERAHCGIIGRLIEPPGGLPGGLGPQAHGSSPGAISALKVRECERSARNPSPTVTEFGSPGRGQGARRQWPCGHGLPC